MNLHLDMGYLYIRRSDLNTKVMLKVEGLQRHNRIIVFRIAAKTSFVIKFYLLIRSLHTFPLSLSLSRAPAPSQYLSYFQSKYFFNNFIAAPSFTLYFNYFRISFLLHPSHCHSFIQGLPPT